MNTVYLHTKFHTSDSSGSFVKDVKPKTKYRTHETAILFYRLQRIPLQKFHIFRRSITPYIIPIL